MVASGYMCPQIICILRNNDMDLKKIMVYIFKEKFWVIFHSIGDNILALIVVVVLKSSSHFLCYENDQIF